MWEGGAILPPTGRGGNIVQQKTILAISKITQLTIKMSETKQMMAGIITPPYASLLTWPQKVTRDSTPVEKTTHLSEDGKRHQDHMVEVLIRRWGCSTRQGGGTHAHPPVRWGIREEALAVCAFFLPGATRRRRGPDTLMCSTNCYAIMWSNEKKSADDWALQGCFSALMAVSTLTCPAPGFSG